MRLNKEFESLVCPLESFNSGILVEYQAGDAESVRRCGLAHTVAVISISFGQIFPLTRDSPGPDIPDDNPRISAVVLRSNDLLHHPSLPHRLATELGSRGRRLVDGPEEDKGDTSRSIWCLMSSVSLAGR